MIFGINLFNVITRLREAILYGEFFSKLLLQYYIRSYTRDITSTLLYRDTLRYKSALVMHRVKCKSMQMQNLKDPRILQRYCCST